MCVCLCVQQIQRDLCCRLRGLATTIPFLFFLAGWLGFGGPDDPHGWAGVSFMTISVAHAPPLCRILLLQGRVSPCKRLPFFSLEKQIRGRNIFFTQTLGFISLSSRYHFGTDLPLISPHTRPGSECAYGSGLPTRSRRSDLCDSGGAPSGQ